MQQTVSVHWLDTTKFQNIESLNAALAKLKNGIVCLTSKQNFELITPNQLIQDLEEIDIIHSGLLFEGSKAMESIQLITFNWNFLNPDSAIRNYSWKATSDFIAFNCTMLDVMGRMDESFTSINAAVLDFTYRALLSGGNVVYDPGYAKVPAHSKREIHKQDEVLFVWKHFSKPTARMFQILRGIFKASAINKNEVKRIDSASFHLVGSKKREINQYTAIIPTINRYEYLDKAIQSLLDVDFPPAEIIIMDQTPVQNRIAGYYDPFRKHNHVRVLFLDTAGQSISRNTAIDLASHEWIYLFDDDSVCWKECMLEHRFVMEHSWADGSTGLSLAPWKDISYIQPQNLFYRIADVLDTGNCFIKKSGLLAIGKLDMAYNKGPGADDDLGKRLYLKGYCIVLNPKAIRTHYKAKSGGLRQYGAWWRNSSALFQAYPPPTQMYMIQKYYPAKFWPFQILLFYMQSQKGQNGFKFLFTLCLSPIKIIRSMLAVKRLKQSHAI